MTATTIPANAPDEVVPPNGPADSAQEAHKEPSVPRRRYGGPIPEGETPQMLRSAVVRLAWPSILENALQSFLQIVTTAMIAQLGAIAIAGVGVSNQILIIGISTFFAVSTATTVMVAFNVGARNPKEASLAAKQSYFLGAIISLVVTVVGFLFAPQFIALLGAAPDVVAEGGAFLRVESLGTLFLVTMMISGGILRGTGDTRTPMLVTGFINIINVAVSLPLIFGLGPVPHLGVIGAACGNIVARIVGCAILLAICYKGRRGVSIAGWEGWRPRADLFRRLMAIGIPNMMESLFRSGGMVLFAVVIVSLGTTAFAAQQVANLFWQMALFPSFGFATAAMTLTGQSLGANNPGRAQQSAWVAVRGCVLWMTIAGAVYFVLGPWLVGPFSANDPEIRRIAADALKVICFSQPIQAIGITLAGSLRGAGDTRWPMFSTGAAMWLVRLPAAYLFGVVLGLGIPGAYAGLIFDSSLVLALNLWRYRSGRWQNARTLSTSAAD